MSTASLARSFRLPLPLVAIVACTSPQAKPEPAQSAAARGEYLVNFGGCNDCHTPKVFSAAGPAPDLTRLLSGHPAETQLPVLPAGVVGADPTKWGAVTTGDLTAWSGPWGTSFAANLTPDATGLAAWNDSLFIATMRTGKHWGSGRGILPPMPWFSLNALTDDDLRAVFAYLRSIKPVANLVPQPLPPAMP
jgi:mono/diheme cytochrome c family protein